MNSTQWPKVVFEVKGEIVGKGRPRFTTQGGFAKAYTPKRTKDYEELVLDSFRLTGAEKSLKAIRLKLYVYKKIAKSTSKKLTKQLVDQEYLCTTKPDIDNIVKVVLDALNGVAYGDDIQVCEMAVIKKFTDKEERLVVVLEEIGECKPKK